MKKLSTLMFALAVVVACGGDDSPDNENENNSNDNNNQNNGGGICSEGATSTDGRLLPYAVGNSWRYRVQDLGTGDFSTKTQELTTEMVPAGETDPVIVQITNKANGSTENWTRLVGDSILRFRQMDYDALGVLEATTTYVPSRIRLDESAERTGVGATWNENYQKVVVDALGIETTVDVTDLWEVIGVDVECSSPLGTFSCLHIRRSRTLGGVAVKDFFFAPGIGKVKEVGGQIEELEDCDLQ
jgi:hypothetical protein